MSRKDYILIAGVLRQAYSTSLDWNTSTNPQAVVEIAQALACALRKDNPRFNPDHFVDVVRGNKSLTSRPARNGVRP